LTELPYRAPDERAELDLHWRLVPWLHEADGAGDPELWRAAHPVTIDQQTALVPAPEDLLLHLITHAYRSGWDRVPRWVADAAMLIRGAGNDLDWDRLAQRVRDGQLVPPVRDALHYASALVDLPIPAKVLTHLRTVPVDDGDQRRYEAGARAITGVRRPLLGAIDDLQIGWHRRTFNLSFEARTRLLAPFVLARTGADHLWSVPFVVARNRRSERANNDA
jgi:hypothetical protein